jgi:hypothetical protein
MAFRVNVPSFSKGEIGPELVARTDVAAYGTGVRRARNVFIRKYGGLSKRMGTRFVAEVFDSSQPVRLLPFQFSIEQAYALEMGQGYMRASALGGMVLNEELAIVGITKALQAQVTAALHAYSVGDQVYFKGVVGMDEINGRTGRVVAVTGADTFTVDIDTRAFGTFVSATGGITRVAPPPAPPEPPVVPPVVDPPEPPETGGGGGGPRKPNEQIP